MKQVLQDTRTGQIESVESPAPRLLPGSVLVRVAASAVSAGTERASSEFASKSLLHKAKARPDLVRDVLKKLRRDGVFSTVAAVQSRLEQPAALGYSSAGTVIEVARDVTGLTVGDRVACAGANYAVHAEFACVPRLLVAKIPSHNISFEQAAFTTLGAVALHGVRTAEVKLGDTVGVIGLGLLGQLTVQILKAAGCRVAGIDLSASRAELALVSGADAVASCPEQFREICRRLSDGNGVDSVLIAAETSSSQPVNLAAEVARDRGIIAAVGTVGIELERKLYYEKELDFRIPRSYGPGRYDAAYEQKGRDYPIGYVRWTETRNMEAFLQLLSDGKVDLNALITHRFPIERAPAAYELITGRVAQPFLGVVLTYSESAGLRTRIESDRALSRRSASISVGLLGAGTFALSTLLPTMSDIKAVRLTGVCAANGSHAKHAADKFGFRYCATGENELLEDPQINTIAIATRHHLHARQVIAAIRGGKHVLCEKPLCLSETELHDITAAYLGSAGEERPLLMVGFNRRFAPMVIELKRFLRDVDEPLAIHYRINAGALAADHWTHDAEQGGGRLLGEVCHFIDLVSFLAGSPAVEVNVRAVTHPARPADDSAILSLMLRNGSHATISYLTDGDRSCSKERIEIIGGGAVAILEDFRFLQLVRDGKKKVMRSRFRQDKGHRGEWQAFASAIRQGKPSPIPFREIVASTLTTLRALESRNSGQTCPIDVSSYLTEKSFTQRAGV
jgi:predicted dehydrogenase/threonine dehydrogenase-like Zn-dependent dehydrogenase